MALVSVVAAIGFLFYRAEGILEQTLNSLVSDRGGMVDVGGIWYDSEDGLCIIIREYTEPDLRITNAEFSVPLLSLLSYPKVLNLKVRIQQAELNMKDGDSALDADLSIVRLQEMSEKLVLQCQALMSYSTSIPFRSLEIEMNDFRALLPKMSVTCNMHLTSNCKPQGLWMTTLRLESDRLGGIARIQLDPASGDLGMDFSMSARDWSEILTNELFALNRELLNYSLDLYLNPMGSGAFLETSGYFRWSAENAELFNFALLGNLGACELFVDESELALKSIAFGIATDGSSIFRAYGNSPLDHFILGNRNFTVGEINLRLDDNTFQTELKLEQNTFELNSANTASLFEGFGELDTALQLNDVDASLLRTFYFDLLPADLSFKLQVQADAKIDVNEWSIDGILASGNWKIPEMSLPSSSLQVTGLAGKSQLHYNLEQATTATTELKAESTNLAGIEITNLFLNLDSNDLKTIRIREHEMNILGGSVATSTSSFSFNGEQAARVNLDIESLNLEKLAAVVPQFRGELCGSVSGDLLIDVEARGLTIASGSLSLDEASDSRLSYSLNGLLTQGLNPYSVDFKQCAMVEQALEDLALNEFKVDFSPMVNEEKPIVLKISGESKQDSGIVPVDYTLNIDTEDSTDLIQFLQRMQQGKLEIN